MIDPQNRVPLYPGRVTLTPVSGNTYDMERADQPTQAGTPLNRDTLRKLQADIRTYPIASGYSISAGDVVDVSGGQVVKTVEAVANVETHLTSSAVTDASVIFLNENYSVVSVLQSGGVSALLVENKPGGALGNLASFAVSSPTNLSLARLSDTQFVVGYVRTNSVYAKVGTVSGTSISFGAEVQLFGLTGAYDHPIVAIDQSRFVCVGYPSDIYVYSVSGTSISNVGHGAMGMSPLDVSATLLSSENGNARICVCCIQNGTNRTGLASIFTIDGANQVTRGTVVTFEENRVYEVSCCSDSSDVIVAYNINSSKKSMVLSVSGNTITTNQSITVSSLSGQSSFPNIIKVGSELIYIERNSGACVLSKQGVLLTPNSFFSFGTNQQYISAASVLDDQLVVAYAAANNSSYGTTTTLEVMGNQIAGSFTNESSTAIALQSGTAGESIECIFSGTTAADFVSDGQVIDSPGVYGVGIMDGILQVWSKDRPGQVVTGSYVGTGTYGSSNPNTLTFDFEPKVIFISAQHVAGMATLIRDCDTSAALRPSDVYELRVTWSENSVSWYNTAGTYTQLNANDTYRYYCLY